MLSFRVEHPVYFACGSERPARRIAGDCRCALQTILAGVAVDAEPLLPADREQLARRDIPAQQGEQT